MSKNWYQRTSSSGRYCTTRIYFPTKHPGHEDQVYRDSVEGARYISFYAVECYPHIAVLDSRTGELMDSYEGFQSPSELISRLSDFLERNSLDDCGPKLNSQTPADLPEEQQLAAAIAASLQEVNASHSGPCVEDSHKEGHRKRKHVGKPEAGQLECVERQQQAEYKKRKIGNAEQPHAIGQSDRVQEHDGRPECTLQIRLADGSVLKGAFPSTFTLRQVQAWVAEQSSDNGPFTLMTPFPRRVFEDTTLDMTLAAAQLVPRAVLVVRVT